MSALRAESEGWYVGLMSGTSADGVDAAMVRTDGERLTGLGAEIFVPYGADLRAEIHGHYGRMPNREAAAIRALESAITDVHIAAVKKVMEVHQREGGGAVQGVGFHGQTMFHAPALGQTCQLGDAAHLAQSTGLPVVGDFRANDMAHGGQGAPLAPIYHKMLVAFLRTEVLLSGAVDEGVVVLNIGGVANATVISGTLGDALQSCDVGPGNGLLDDWVRGHGLGDYDAGGALAAQGQVDEALVRRWLEHPYFRREAPKSLDRQTFHSCLEEAQSLSVVDGAATLCAFSAAAIAGCGEAFGGGGEALEGAWLVTGGGAHNRVLCQRIEAHLGRGLLRLEMGDMVEAQAFGVLAARSLRGLPLSYPGTTGVARAVCGGVHHAPA